MSKTILLAPNSFKESADSVTISSTIFRFLEADKNYKLIEKPLSDGGDGFLNVCEKIFNTNRLTYYIQRVYDNQSKPVYLLHSQEERSIYIESAEIIGLKEVPSDLRNPLYFSTKNLGNLLEQLSNSVKKKDVHIEKVVIGVGGTATVDFGLGLASVFSLKVFDENDNELEVIPANYLKVKRIAYSKTSLPFKIEVIADVTTPLFGSNNAIQLYSKQKGVTIDQTNYLNKGFNNIYNILKNNKIIESDKKMNGSGGGLAAGLKIFLGASIKPAEKFIEHEILCDVDTSEIDAVITGEGAFDKQSFEDKGAYIIIKKFKDFNIPVFLICGKFDKSVIKMLPDNVIVLELQKHFSSIEESIKNYKIGLRKVTEIIKNHLKN